MKKNQNLVVLIDLVSVQSIDAHSSSIIRGSFMSSWFRSVMPVSEFEKLLEDLQDLAVVAERREEKEIDHQKLMDELKDAGIL